MNIGIAELLLILVFMACIFILIIGAAAAVSAWVASRALDKQGGSERVKCANCGKTSPHDAKFCLHCGTQIEDA